GVPVWGIALIGIGLVLAAEPAWRRIDALMRARLEKDLRGELQTLLTLGTGHTGASPLQVASTVVKLVDRVIHPANNVLLVIQDGYARPLASQGYPVAPQEPLPPGHLLTHWLSNHKAPVFHDDLMVEPQFQTMSVESLEAFSSLGATIYVPLAGRDSLEGILAVGPKAGRSIYSWQEIEFLRTLGQQGAMLLESIRLSEADRAQRERMEHMREIQRSMVQARDEERRSLAAEIHDEPIQMLVGSVVRLNLIRDSLLTRPDMSQEQLDHVVTSLGRAEKSLRRIMTGVFPSLLHDLGLLAALEALCQDLERGGLARTKVHLTMEVKGVPSDWNPPLPVGLVIYRFIQEGLRNVLAHSGATEVRATVEYTAEAATVEVLDNGHGIDPQRVLSRRQEGHVGLVGLEERLGAVGGSISLDDRPEGGARLSGHFPHESPSPDPQASWSVEYDFVPLPAPEPVTRTADKAPVRGHQ
ncbi:MAG: histidine kinase, partial [Dehalococcoidia bacterium]